MGNRTKKMLARYDARQADWQKTQNDVSRGGAKANPAGFRKPGSRKIKQ